MSTDYNGWTNRETWLINLWYEPCTVEDVEDAKHHLVESYHEMDQGPLKDMLDISKINWEELRQEARDND